MTILRAHFDGKQIRLDEPFDLDPDAKLLVTVLQHEQPTDDQAAWERLAQRSLEAAYGDDEPEYDLDCLREPNPAYAGR
jgi:hypothetical protein